MENKFKKPALPGSVINWIFAMGIIEYPIGKQRPVISFMYSLITVTVFCAFAAYTYPYVLRMTNEFEANKKIINFMYIAHIVITIITIVSGWQRGKGMRRIICKAGLVEQLLDSIGVLIKYKKAFIWQMKSYTFAFTCAFVTMFLNTVTILWNDHQNLPKITIALVINYPFIIMFIVDTTFVNTVRYIEDKFKKLNNALKGLLTSSRASPQHVNIVKRYLKTNEESDNVMLSEPPVEDVETLLKIAKQAYSELVGLCEETSQVFGFQILLSVTVAIAMITGSLYHTYVLIMFTKISRFNILRMLLNLFVWFCYYTMKAFAFSESCGSAAEESVVTGDIISEYYDEAFSNSNIQKEIRDFLMYLIKNEVKFQACGFFTLNFTLVHSIIGSVTTYLMIISQFGNFVTPICSNTTCV